MKNFLLLFTLFFSAHEVFSLEKYIRIRAQFLFQDKIFRNVCLTVDSLQAEKSMFFLLEIMFCMQIEKPTIVPIHLLGKMNSC